LVEQLSTRRNTAGALPDQNIAPAPCPLFAPAPRFSGHAYSLSTYRHFSRLQTGHKVTAAYRLRKRFLQKNGNLPILATQRSNFMLQCTNLCYTESITVF